VENTPTTAAALSHTEFIAAYRDGSIIVNFEPKAAARFLSGRLLLPLFMMPVLGIGVALALSGWIWTGLLVIALGIILPRLIKRGAPHFLMQQVLDDGNLYQELLRDGVIQLVRRGPG
jgi:hypothetical protein